MTADQDAIRESLAKQVAELKDAERYRWLRDPNRIQNATRGEMLFVHCDGVNGHRYWALAGEPLDAAIDAAITATKREFKG